MQTRFEQFALTSMIGVEDAPPRLDGKLCFAHGWERQVFGVALALSKAGHFDWEDFRRELIDAIGDWEQNNALDDPSWNYYEQWLTALERVVVRERLLKHDELVDAASGSL